MNTTSNVSHRLSKRLTNYNEYLTRIDNCIPYRYGVCDDTSNFYSMVCLQRRFVEKGFIHNMFNMLNNPESKEILGTEIMCNFYTLLIYQQKRKQ
jgi:hypothetical protein